MANEDKTELDLLDILQSIGKWFLKLFRSIVHALGWVLRLLYRHFLCFIVTVVLMCVLCALQNKQKLYRGEADLKASSFSSYFIKGILDPLHFQSVYSDSFSIAEKMNIPVSVASQISDIQGYYYIDIHNDGIPDYIDYENTYDMNDTTMSILPWRIRIAVESKDTSLFSKMKDAVTFAITNNEQVMRENELRISQMDQKIQSIDYEIKLLDSLRKKEYFERKKDISVSMDKMVMLNERETKLYHSDILELERAKMDVIWERSIFTNGIAFENDFEINPKPINSCSKTYPKYILVGVILSILLSCIWENKESIQNFFKK